MTPRDDTRRHLEPVEPPDDYGDDTGRTPRHNLEAEQELLGALLRTPELAPHLVDDLDPGDFYQPRHETLWVTIQGIAATGDHATPALVIDRLQADHALRPGHLDGPYLHTLYAIPAGTTSVEAAQRLTTAILDTSRVRQAETALTRMAQVLRTGGADDIDDALAALQDDIDQAVAKVGSTATRQIVSSWATLNLADVLAGGEIDPPPSLLPRDDGHHLIYAGAVHTFSGEPGSAKTWLLLQAALAELQTGKDVAMVDFEDRASRVVGRLLAIGAYPDQIHDHFRYVRPNVGLDDNGRRALARAITGCSLVILDGVTEAMTLHGLDLSSNPDVATFLALLPRWIADHGPAVAMIDHVVKDTDRQGRWSLGGQHKLAGIDGAAYLVKAVEPFGRGRHGRARVTIAKDRPGHVEEIALGRTACEFTLDARDENCLRAVVEAPTAIPTDAAGDMRPTVLMERVSRWVEINPGATRRAISETVAGKDTYVRRAIDRLIQEGYMDVTDGPRRVQYHRVSDPFRNDPDERIT